MLCAVGEIQDDARRHGQEITATGRGKETQAGAIHEGRTGETRTVSAENTRLYWYRNDYRRLLIIATHIISPKKGIFKCRYIMTLFIINANLVSCSFRKS